jgi:hemoglobin-like flavoprotein
MNRIQVHRIRSSFEWFRPCGPAMIARVFRELGDHNPGVRALFPEDTARLNVRLFETLGQVVKALPRFHSLEEALMELGAKAAQAGAHPGHYGIVRDELLSTMSQLAGNDWTEELANDWTLVLDAVSGAMMRGALGGRAAEAA